MTVKATEAADVSVKVPEVPVAAASAPSADAPPADKVDTKVESPVNPEAAVSSKEGDAAVTAATTE